MQGGSSGPTPPTAGSAGGVRQVAEAGPNHEVDGVVRWRRIDLKRVIPTNSASSFMGSPIQTVDISALERTHSETELIAPA